mgnify:CR=1 FL=1
MDNGLSGRYLTSLEKWNQARSLAATLIDAFYDSRLEEAIEDVDTIFVVPPAQNLKSKLMEIVFVNQEDAVDNVARSIMQWDLAKPTVNRSQSIAPA